MFDFLWNIHRACNQLVEQPNICWHFVLQNRWLNCNNWFVRHPFSQYFNVHLTPLLKHFLLTVSALPCLAQHMAVQCQRSCDWPVVCGPSRCPTAELPEVSYTQKYHPLQTPHIATHPCAYTHTHTHTLKNPSLFSSTVRHYVYFLRMRSKQYIEYFNAYISSSACKCYPSLKHNYIPLFQVCIIDPSGVYFVPASQAVIPLALTMLFQLLAFVLMLTRACTWKPHLCKS